MSRLRCWLARTRTVVESLSGHPRQREALAALGGAGRVLGELVSIDTPALPVQLTHGDYGHDNLRFAGDEPVALLDLDFAGFRPRAADLADLAFAPHWMPSFGQLERDPAGRDWDRVVDLVRRYDATARQPLDVAEIAALPALMARLPVTWAAMGWLTQDPVGAVADLGMEIDVAAWLLAHRDELAHAWGGS